MFLGLLSIGLNAQGGSQELLDTNNVHVRAWANEADSLGSIFWKCDSLQPGDLFTVHKAYSGLQSDDSMHVGDTWQDSLSGLYHIAYVQYYKGIKVEFSSYTEHHNGSCVLSSNGWIIEGLDMSVDPTLTESEALLGLLDYIDADGYSWTVYDPCDTVYNGDDTVLTYFCNDDSSSYPQGELVLYNPFSDNMPGNYLLAWKFDITTSAPKESSVVYYVDAITGDLISLMDNSWHNTADHWQYGTVTIDTKWRSWNHDYYLWANDDNRAVKTQNWSIQWRDDDWGWDKKVHDKDDNWGTDYRSLTSSHYVATQAWIMFKAWFGHSGLDGFNKELRVQVKDFDDGGGTFFTTHGDVTSNADFIVISKENGYLQCPYDIIGHEFAHAVSTNTRKFDHNHWEAPAIAESYGDIFGVLSEKYSQPFSWDWEIGEDVNNNSRKLSDPGNQPFHHSVANIEAYPDYYPTVYGVGNWYTGHYDFYGSHVNSSIQSLCFYLLSVGGTNNGNAVTGIGIEKASAIAFYAMRNLVEQQETYYLSREHWLHAAAVLYGRCSSEYFETCRAWHAVGVGTYCQECNIANPGWDWMNCYNGPPVPMQTRLADVKKVIPEIKVYPNPAIKEVNVSFMEISNVKRFLGSVSLCGLDGKEIIGNIPFDRNSDIVKIDVSTLVPGMYFIIVKSENGVFSYKITVE